MGIFEVISDFYGFGGAETHGALPLEPRRISPTFSFVQLRSCAGRGATEQCIHLKPRAWPPTTSCLAGSEDSTRIISFTSAIAGFSTDELLRTQ